MVGIGSGSVREGVHSIETARVEGAGKVGLSGEETTGFVDCSSSGRVSEPAAGRVEEIEGAGIGSVGEARVKTGLELAGCEVEA